MYGIANPVDEVKKAIGADRELTMFRYYMRKGHTLSSLLELDPLERTFYLACFEMDMEDIERSNNG